MKLSLDMFDTFLHPLFKNNRMAVIVTFFLVFYGGSASPKLPTFIVDLFNNSVFRVFVLSLIVYKANKNPVLSLMIAIGFTLIMDAVNKQKLFEKFISFKVNERFTGEINCTQTDEYKKLKSEAIKSYDISKLEEYLSNCYNMKSDISKDQDTDYINYDISELGDETKFRLISNLQMLQLPPDIIGTIIDKINDKIRNNKSHILSEEEIKNLIPIDKQQDISISSIIYELENIDLSNTPTDTPIDTDTPTDTISE